MSAIINGSIRVDRLPKEKFIKGKDGAVYYNFTIAVQDETRYGNNVAFMDSQTKEEREAKVAKTYLGNGKVVWMSPDGVTVAERDDQPQAVAEPASDAFKRACFNLGIGRGLYDYPLIQIQLTADEFDKSTGKEKLNK